MQPCSRELQAMNSLLNPTQQIPLQHLQINAHHQHQLFDDHNPTSSHDDFLDQILSNTTSLPSSSWSDPIKSPWDNQPKSDIYHNNAGFHYDEINLASKLRQNQINGGDSTTTAMKMMMMMMQQQMILAGKSTVTSAAGGGIIDGSLQALYNGFDDGSLHHPQFQGGTMQTKSFGANSAAEMNQSTKGSGSTAEAAAAASEKPKQKVRARRGHATDPHSIAERLRRVRIAERMKSLQELVPSANKTDKASMLDEIIDYVKFLQLQVKVLSMSRLGGAAAVAPLVTDMPSEGGGDCVQTSIGRSLPQNFDGNQTSSANDSLTITEHQVAKLMEEDMGSAMQYLHGKGLCLMPISLATTISTSPSRSRNPVTNNLNANTGNGNHLLVQSSGGDGHSSPSVSVLTVQSTIMGSAGIDGAASISET